MNNRYGSFREQLLELQAGRLTGRSVTVFVSPTPAPQVALFDRREKVGRDGRPRRRPGRLITASTFDNANYRMLPVIDLNRPIRHV